MYAIIETGSKQYRVEEGDIIDIELLTAKDNKLVEFKHILFLSDGTKMHVGAPHVKGFSVKGEILKENKGPKVIAFKYKRRKNYHRKKGHRQKYLKVKITQITAG